MFGKITIGENMSDLNKSRIKFFGSIAIIIAIIMLVRGFINKNPNIDKNSHFYVNSIYMSDGSFYYKLDDREKILYDTIMDNVKKGKKYIKMHPSDYECTNYKELGEMIDNVWETILLDHPELLSFGTYRWNYKYKTDILKLRIRDPLKSGLMNFFGEMVVNYKVKKLVKETEGMTDKEKIIYVYNWMGKTSKYNTQYTKATNNQTIYSVFVNHNSVCAGFAKSAQVIFQRMGINSYLVKGMTSGLHMWNIIEVDGKYYYFDSTIAASLPKTDSRYYLGLDNEYLIKNNRNLHPDWSPELENGSLFSKNELRG